MKKYRIILIIVTIVVLLASIYVLITRPLLHVEYSGTIEKYRFDVKGYSYFQLNNDPNWYEMHYLDCDLKTEDSMVKKMDDYVIWHYRDGTLIGKYNAVFGWRLK